MKNLTPEQLVAICTSIATFINSMILWPIVKALKNTTVSHDKRLTDLEEK